MHRVGIFHFIGKNRLPSWNSMSSSENTSTADSPHIRHIYLITQLCRKQMYSGKFSILMQSTCPLTAGVWSIEIPYCRCLHVSLDCNQRLQIFIWMCTGAHAGVVLPVYMLENIKNAWAYVLSVSQWRIHLSRCLLVRVSTHLLFLASKTTWAWRRDLGMPEGMRIDVERETVHIFSSEREKLENLYSRKHLV